MYMKVGQNFIRYITNPGGLRPSCADRYVSDYAIVHTNAFQVSNQFEYVLFMYMKWV